MRRRRARPSRPARRRCRRPSRRASRARPSPCRRPCRSSRCTCRPSCRRRRRRPCRGPPDLVALVVDDRCRLLPEPVEEPHRLSSLLTATTAYSRRAYRGGACASRWSRSWRCSRCAAPRRPTADSPAATKRIVRAWSARLNAYDNVGVAKLFARPAVFVQSGAGSARDGGGHRAVAPPAALRRPDRVDHGEGRARDRRLRPRQRQEPPLRRPGRQGRSRFRVRNGKIVTWAQIPVPKPRAQPPERAGNHVSPTSPFVNERHGVRGVGLPAGKAGLRPRRGREPGRMIGRTPIRRQRGLSDLGRGRAAGGRFAAREAESVDLARREGGGPAGGTAGFPPPRRNAPGCGFRGRFEGGDPSRGHRRELVALRPSHAVLRSAADPVGARP